MSDLRDRRGRVRGSTRKVGVIGWPIEHTLSPVIHNAAFVALGMDWVYVPLPVAAARLPAALDGLGALGFAGANVTMPHKRTWRPTSTASETRRLAAVNTVVVGPGGSLAQHRRRDSTGSASRRRVRCRGPAVLFLRGAPARRALASRGRAPSADRCRRTRPGRGIRHGRGFDQIRGRRPR
jgi:shikimate dehydrogenase